MEVKRKERLRDLEGNNGDNSSNIQRATNATGKSGRGDVRKKVNGTEST